MKFFDARLLITSLVTLTVMPLDAQTVTWNDGGADQSWSDKNNWSSAVVPGVALQPPAPGTGSATFGFNVVIGTLSTSNATTSPIVLDTSGITTTDEAVSIGSLTFNNATSVK